MPQRLERPQQGVARLSRNEIDAARIVYLVRKRRLNLEFVNYSFDPSPEGIMMLQMALSQSQYYSSKLAKDVWRGMESKIARGWCPFRAPEGYKNDAETRTVVADAERFPLIRAAWDRLLTGAYTVTQHLLVAPALAGSVHPEDGAGRPRGGASKGPKSRRFELRIPGSGSTKKATFSAAFSCGGPMEALGERLWQFYSVNERFTPIPCLAEKGEDPDHPTDWQS